MIDGWIWTDPRMAGARAIAWRNGAYMTRGYRLLARRRAIGRRNLRTVTCCVVRSQGEAWL